MKLTTSLTFIAAAFGLTQAAAVEERQATGFDATAWLNLDCRSRNANDRFTWSNVNINGCFEFHNSAGLKVMKSMGIQQGSPMPRALVYRQAGCKGEALTPRNGAGCLSLDDVGFRSFKIVR